MTKRLTTFEATFVSHLLSGLNLDKSNIHDLVEQFQVSLSFDLNDKGEVIMSGSKRQRSEPRGSEIVFLGNTRSNGMPQSVETEIQTESVVSETSECNFESNVIPMWFFRYGKGMIGIPLEGSTFTCDFREFAEHYGIPWYYMLKEHIFYKPAGSLQSMPWNCFFFRTKAIEYYKECFSNKRLGSFPLFPGTDLPIVPPHWSAWKKVGSKFLKEHKLGLKNPEIWQELPALGLHLYPYGKAYRFDVHYTNVARRYYSVSNVVAGTGQNIGYYRNDYLKAWAVYKYLTVYQIRGSQLQSYLEQGAST